MNIAYDLKTASRLRVSLMKLTTVLTDAIVNKKTSKEVQLLLDQRYRVEFNIMKSLSNKVDAMVDDVGYSLGDNDGL